MIARSRLEPRRSVSRSTEPQLLGRERPRRRRVDLDARHARRDQRARVQQRRRGSERQVDRRGRLATVDEAPAPVAEHRATVVLATGREERRELVAGVEMRDELAHDGSGRRVVPRVEMSTAVAGRERRGRRSGGPLGNATSLVGKRCRALLSGSG
jgi:hypothetical protein